VYWPYEPLRLPQDTGVSIQRLPLVNFLIGPTSNQALAQARLRQLLNSYPSYKSLPIFPSEIPLRE
jgi:hypothetical protein